MRAFLLRCLPMLRFASCFFCILLCGLVGCQPKPSDPVCRVNSAQASSYLGNGACLIRVNNTLLMLQNNQGKFSLPGGMAIGGRNAQCAAHHHLWLQTGLNAEVGRHLGQDAQGRQVFHCKLHGQLSGKLAELPVPDWASNKVKAIRLQDPFVIHSKAWREHNELSQVREWFVLVD